MSLTHVLAPMVESAARGLDTIRRSIATMLTRIASYLEAAVGACGSPRRLIELMSAQVIEQDVLGIASGVRELIGVGAGPTSIGIDVLADAGILAAAAHACVALAAARGMCGVLGEAARDIRGACDALDRLGPPPASAEGIREYARRVREALEPWVSRLERGGSLRRCVAALLRSLISLVDEVCRALGVA